MDVLKAGLALVLVGGLVSFTTLEYSEAFNHPTDGDSHILLTGRTASGYSRVS
jgi:hypothetical protein